jgi:hypothetical protein
MRKGDTAVAPKPPPPPAPPKATQSKSVPKNTNEIAQRIEPVLPAGLDPSNPNEAPSRIYGEEAAYSRQKDGGANALAVTLTNQRIPPSRGH